ncbi:MAG: death domain-containing protein [Sedimenticola sp.]
MLKEPPPILMKDDCTRTQKLCINTKDGFLPAVIFQGLVAGCVSKWKISRQKDKDLIYCGYGCFDIDIFHRMMLYFSDSTIQMWVSCYNKNMPGPNPDLCAEVREYVLQTLQKIITCLSLSQCSNLELSIKCPDIQELNELPGNGMFKIDELVKQRSDVNVIICHAHEESHHVCCSELLQHWYGENSRHDSDDDNCTGEKILTDKQLRNIADKIGKEYEWLGIELDLPQEKIDQIKQNNPYDVVNQTAKILQAWKERVGRQATFSVLKQAMLTVGIDATTALAGIK